nr:hypothetical protein [Tanacetum cinerariifolium]
MPAGIVDIAHRDVGSDVWNYSGEVRVYEGVLRDERGIGILGGKFWYWVVRDGVRVWGNYSFGVDAIEDFKEYTLRDYYCWLKTYCCLYKLKLLDNATDPRLRLLEESHAADEKIKK